MFTCIHMYVNRKQIKNSCSIMVFKQGTAENQVKQL